MHLTSPVGEWQQKTINREQSKPQDSEPNPRGAIFCLFVVFYLNVRDPTDPFEFARTDFIKLNE